MKNGFSTGSGFEAKAPHPESQGDMLRIGISSCLLGEKVRYDGRDKRDNWLCDSLGPWVNWVSVCPEYEIGLGVPRPPIHLVDASPHPRLIEISTGRDLSEQMEAFCRSKTHELLQLGLDAFIFKRKSPSCGMESTPIHDIQAKVISWDSGLFARYLKAEAPLLPWVDEERLKDPDTRDDFLTRSWCRMRWRQLRTKYSDVQGLVEFHREHSLLMESFKAGSSRRPAILLPGSAHNISEQLIDRYELMFFRTLSIPRTRESHAHGFRYILEALLDFREESDAGGAADVIENYRRGLISRSSPLNLLRNIYRSLNSFCPATERALEAFPEELENRNRPIDRPE